jgi:signal transduction histidine kinase
VGKVSEALERLNIQHRMMLWFTAIILGVLGCVLLFLHLRITRDMRNQVYSELMRTRTLFENIHRMSGEDLQSQCLILANLTRLRAAVTRQSPEEVQSVLEDYATMPGAEAVLITTPDGRPLASRGLPAPRGHRAPLYDSVRQALAGATPPGIDVSAAGIYQTAWCRVRHARTGMPVGLLVLGTPIDKRLAIRLSSMSGAAITFFAPRPGSDAPVPTVVASTLPGEAMLRLQEAMLAMGRNPLSVPSEGLESPYVMDLGEEVQYLSVTAPIRGEGRKVVGAYVIQRPLQEEFRLLDRMRLTLIFVGVVAVLLGLCASFIVANGVGRRIHGVVRAAEGLSAGDWSRRVPIEGPKDLRVLAEAFNRMASRLQGWDAELRAEVALRTEELNQALARLDSNLRQMRQFHADASHELRTPLTIMRGEVEVALRTSRTPEEYQRVLASVLEEMNRVSAIVEHLLLLARADSGQILIERAPVSIDALLEELHPQAVLLAGRKEITVTLEKEGPVMVLGDSDKLRQLFLNLIDNAIKYTPEGGQVRLRVRGDSGFAVVSVEDTGIGIAPEDVPHIFDRFFRADRARSREMGGTGLGLAICQWIIDGHHGWIDVQSTLGEGSCFTVYIPRVDPSGPVDASAPGHPADD